MLFGIIAIAAIVYGIVNVPHVMLTIVGAVIVAHLFKGNQNEKSSQTT